MKENLKGRIIISRTHSNVEPHEFMSLTLTDSISGTRVIDARMSLKEFARAITSTNADCTFSLYGDCAGMKRETKEEIVFVPDGPHKERKERAKEALAEYEVDGWIGDVSDATNHHRRVGKEHDGGKDYRVSFVRFVDAEDAQDEG